MPLTIETCVATHLGDRKEQQDRVSLFPHPNRKGLLMAVLADGMGGHTGGALAAEQVLHKAKQNFEHWAPASDTPVELLDGIINEAHLMIKLSRFTSEQDPHSTAVVLLLQASRADWAHAGDSRLYLFRGARLVRRTDDHSLVAEMVRKGMITPEEALVHPRRNLLVNCLGSDDSPGIDHGECSPLMPGDCFVLCSDGLWAYFRDDELGQIVASHPPREAAGILMERARERGRGSGDNISLVVVRLADVPLLEPEDRGGGEEKTRPLPLADATASLGPGSMFPPSAHSGEAALPILDLSDPVLPRS